MNKPIALQFYSVRDESSKDFIGTLEKVAEIGYEGIEFAGFGDLKASELKGHLDRLGLKAVGSHTPRELLQNNLDEVIEYHLEIGSKYIACPYFKADTRDGYLEVAKFFNKVGEECRKKGLVFCYHNHDFELTKFDGTYALDLLYENTDPENMQAEIDTYWVNFAGIDEAEYVLKYAGRCPLVHIKDRKARNSDRHAFTEVGTGIIDIKRLVLASEKAGAEWLIVEQDKSEMPSLKSVEISFNNLKKIVAGI
jgi:sugar phosphate isomerase/epimerase